ncbi:MAG: hypothetical protein ACFFD1_06810, partial [Candidatus Thorarchaeota archaeon]
MNLKHKFQLIFKTNKVYFCVFLFFLFFINLQTTNSVETIPPTWKNCTLNQSNTLTDVTSASVIGPFWDALIGMKIGDQKTFIVTKDQNP